MRLHGFYRSSAAYRVRIALHLKGIAFEQTTHHLRRGEQRAPDYLSINPQGLVPALEIDDGTILTQSLSIIAWLDEHYPEPRLQPADSLLRARVWGFAYAIACEIHPVQNTRVLARVKELAGEDAMQEWAKAINAQGLAECEALLANQPGPYCFGDTLTLADVCLVPQMANARRYGADISKLHRLLEADALARKHPAFIAAEPDRQPDAE